MRLGIYHSNNLFVKRFVSMRPARCGWQLVDGRKKRNSCPLRPAFPLLNLWIHVFRVPTFSTEVTQNNS